MDATSTNSSFSEDSMPPQDIAYELNKETEVPNTDGGLFKTVLVEGTGSIPVKGAKVTVHYVGTLLDGTQFDSSRDRNDYFEFTLGKGQVIKGWDKGVATMRVGEKAILKCSPEYGYGAAGSPPSIPPNATLLFEVELFDWTRDVDISAQKDRSIMKDVLVDGVDYENPDFESAVTLDLSIFVGSAGGTATPVWEKKGWSIEIGETPLPPILDECLKSMRKRETAVCRINSSIIPDAHPEFCIPAADEREGQEVAYLIEVHELKTVKSWEFSGLEKVAQGVARKDKGNAVFKQGNLVLAERYYRRSMEFIGEDYGFEGDVKEEAHKARVLTMGNLSQVLLMRKEYTEAISFCEKILALDAKNSKALFRMAKAMDSRQDWEAALLTIEKLLALEPENADAKAVKAHIQASQKAFDNAQKSMFKKMFS